MIDDATAAPDTAATKAELDLLTREFFDAFDNRDGRTADVARLRRLMLPEGVIVVTGPAYAVYGVEEFIAPREVLLSDGRLTDFHEWEVSERTEIVPGVACRIGTYRKSGTLNGAPYDATGTKTFQFVHTPSGWRIAAFSWHDEQ
ncbi:nuclear transport factor 2 family protein [Kitasatospora sp. NPDC088134]|uniref:nuclear transport factor 2 family protein n=1 Tax=Kitasatospora sp. NPDC088134 TaxID=3364071 RepID=UPI00381A6727